MFSDGTMGTLETLMIEGLSETNLSMTLIRKYIRQVHAHYIAYANDMNIITADKWIRKHKSHRGHSNTMDKTLLNEYTNNPEYTEIRKLYEPLYDDSSIPLVQLPSTTSRSVETTFSEEDVELDRNKEYVPVNYHIIDDENYIAEVAMSMLESENDDLERELFCVLQRLNELDI